MIIVSDECIGELYHSDHMEWRCYKKKEIKVGTYLVGGCVVKDNVILGDQNGKIYKIVFDELSEANPERAHEKSLKKWDIIYHLSFLIYIFNFFTLWALFIFFPILFFLPLFSRICLISFLLLFTLSFFILALNNRLVILPISFKN